MLEKLQKMAELLGFNGDASKLPKEFQSLFRSYTALKKDLDSLADEKQKDLHDTKEEDGFEYVSKGDAETAQTGDTKGDWLDKTNKSVYENLKKFEKDCKFLLEYNSQYLGENETLSVIDCVNTAGVEKANYEGKHIADPNPELDTIGDFSEKFDEHANPLISEQERKTRIDVASDFIRRDKLSYPEKYADANKIRKRLKEVGSALKKADEAFKKEKETNENLKGENGAVPQNDLTDSLNKVVAQSAINMHLARSYGSREAEILKDIALKSLDSGTKKTLSEIYKGQGKEDVDIKSLFEAGLLRDKHGNPYEISTEPNAVIDKFLADVRNGEPVYAESPDGTDSYRIGKAQDLTDKKNKKEQVKAFQQSQKLVKASTKKATLQALKELHRQLASFDNDKISEEFAALKFNCEQTIDKVNDAVFKDTFNKVLDDFGQACDKYTYEATGKKPSRQRLTEINLSQVGRDIVNQAKNEKEDPKVDNLAATRRTIAAKCIRAFAESAKNSENEAVKERADAILNDPKRLDIEIKNCLKTPAFIAMFGSERSLSKVDTLNDALNKDGADLFADVKNKQAQMTKEEHKKIIAENYKKNLVDRRPVSDPQREDLANCIAQLNAELKSVYGGTSPEYEQFRRELNITNIRLQNGSPYMNIRKQMAHLAQTANKYFDKKIDGPLGKYEATRTSVAGRIMQICDNLNQDKMPSERLPRTAGQIDKQNVAAKLVHATANKMRNTGDPDLMAEANKILTDPVEFSRRTEQMQKEEAFRNITADGGRSLLKEDGEKALAKLTKETKRLKEQAIAKEKARQEEAEKEREKEKEKGKETEPEKNSKETEQNKPVVNEAEKKEAEKKQAEKKEAEKKQEQKEPEKNKDQKQSEKKKDETQKGGPDTKKIEDEKKKDAVGGPVLGG